jgi:hypothetical protein
MKVSTKTKTMKIAEVGRAWTMIENSMAGNFLLLAILSFFGYAIYSAAHHVRFQDRSQIHGATSAR